MSFAIDASTPFGARPARHLQAVKGGEGLELTELLVQIG
jgi:hypothetical protein